MPVDAVTVPRGQAQLFLDERLVAETQNVVGRWHQFRKHPSNPLILASGPEETAFLFGTVLYEPDPIVGGDPVFRMWYYAAGGGQAWIAHAESDDGLVWEKRDLAHIEIGGDTANNAVFFPPERRLIGLSGVIRDPDPDVPRDQRYKLMIPSQRGKRRKEYLLVTSSDGVHWQAQGSFTPDKPAYPDRACFTWDPFRERYVLYTRSKHAPTELVERGGPGYFGRAITRCESADFRHWTTGERVMAADANDPDGTEIYGMAAFPYEGQWVGLPQIFRSLPELSCIDVAVAHSRDGVAWHRVREPVLPNGGIGEWDRFNQCASTAPVRVGDELWVYYSGRLYRHKEYREFTDLTDDGPRHAAIGLATLRVDGWRSYEASFDGGHIVTRPVILPEAALYVNAKVDWGEVVVEVSPVGSERGKAIRSHPVSGDGASQEVEWPERMSPARFGSAPVQLRFALRNALLYSWKVE